MWDDDICIEEVQPGISEEDAREMRRAIVAHKVNELIPVINELVHLPWTLYERTNSRQVPLDTADLEVVAALRTAYSQKGWHVYGLRIGQQFYLEFHFQKGFETYGNA